LVGYACSVPSDLVEAPAIHLLRMFMIAVALHLFVSFAPFTDPGEINGFWHYNKTLLLRLIVTAVYSVVLYAGLALALAALDNLFGMDVPGKRYPQLWFIILGVFNTWSFLAEMPENFDQLEQSTDYPKWIKIFTQYILFPLVLVYLVILYAYIAKIIIDWSWPQGWVSRLILGFATTGIFSIILLYPIRDQAENIWIKKASRWLYVLMIPLVVMLLLALWRRISEYGITEGRYIGIVLGIWLGGIVIYFILSKSKSIKRIPLSLCILTLIISFGPWSAFSISEKSQVDRLHDLLTKNNILIDSRIQKAPVTVTQDDVLQISSIIAYLHDIHGYDMIQPWFKKSLKEDSLGTGLRFKEPALVTKMMGIEYIKIWYRVEGNNIFLRSDQTGLINIQGYDRMIRGQYFNIDQDKKVFTDQNIRYQVNSKLDSITFIVISDTTVPDSLHIDLNPLFNQLLAEYSNINVTNISPENMMVMEENQNLRIKIYFRYIKLHKEETVTEPIQYSADILYKVKNKKLKR
jgi:hypothetical protein